MEYVITGIHVIAALFLVLVVLLQSGRAGGMGAAFGGGSSNVFGARGAGNLLTKLTGASAVIFFLTSFSLSVMSSKTGSIVQGEGSAPAASAPAGASAPAAAPQAAEAAKPEAAPAAAAEPTSASAPAPTK